MNTLEADYRMGEAIKSDDPNAVDKIKQKIAMLEKSPDKWGYNKVEIRRLKGRLLSLSPDEMKAGKTIYVNGLEATYENIIKIFDEGKAVKSRYKPEENRFYLDILLEFSDGKRRYSGYLGSEVNEGKTAISTYGNRENNYQSIWKELTDVDKFYLVINQISGTGNKAVIYSILKDLDPTRAERLEKIEEEFDEGKVVTINGEKAKIYNNKELVRLQILFDGKPNEETRSKLKSNGFKWAPSQNAWQRLLNSNAAYALNRIIDK